MEYETVGALNENGVIESDRSINDVARLTGTTSRTLRHYDNIGLLPPSRIGANGYRYYNTDALARLQRILLLRELGLGLAAIAEVLTGQRDDTRALENHLRLLEAEKQRIDRLIASVTTTIHKFTKGETLMAEEMFDGFDHTQYKEEVQQRWGAGAYAASNEWWAAQSVTATVDRKSPTISAWLICMWLTRASLETMAGRLGQSLCGPPWSPSPTNAVSKAIGWGGWRSASHCPSEESQRRENHHVSICYPRFPGSSGCGS